MADGEGAARDLPRRSARLYTVRERLTALRAGTEELVPRLIDLAALERDSAVASLHDVTHDLRDVEDELSDLALSAGDFDDARVPPVRLLFAYAPLPYLVTDTHGVILVANHAAGVLLARRPEELGGVPIAGFAGPPPGGLRRVLTAAAASAVPRSASLSLRSPHRLPRQVRVTVQRFAVDPSSPVLLWQLHPSLAADPVPLARPVGAAPAEPHRAGANGVEGASRTRNVLERPEEMRPGAQRATPGAEPAPHRTDHATPCGAGDPRPAPGDGRSAPAGEVPDREAPDLDTPHLDTSPSRAPGRGSPDTGRRDTGRPDTGRPHRAPSDRAAPQPGGTDPGAPDTGRRDTGRPDTGRPHRAPSDRATPQPGGTDPGAPGRGSPDPEAPYPEALPESDALAGAVLELASTLIAEMDLPDALTRVAAVAVRGVPAAQGASVTLLEPPSSGASDERVQRADRVQADEQDGPGVAAVAEGRTVVADDIATDPRWAAGGPRVAVETGFRAVLAIPLVDGGAVLGALTLYAATPGGFGPGAVAGAEVLAAPVEARVANVRAYRASLHVAEELRHGLVSRAVIDQAKGILMVQHGLTADQAFAVLTRFSQQENRKLRDVATELVDSSVRQSRSRHSGRSNG